MVRLIKGSIEAKEHMQKLREMRGGSVKSGFIKSIIYKEGSFQPSLMKENTKSNFISKGKFNDKDHSIAHLNIPRLEKDRDDAIDYIQNFKQIDRRKKENKGAVDILQQHHEKRNDANNKLHERKQIIHSRKHKVREDAIKKGKYGDNDF